MSFSVKKNENYEVLTLKISIKFRHFECKNKVFQSARNRKIIIPRLNRMSHANSKLDVNNYSGLLASDVIECIPSYRPATAGFDSSLDVNKYMGLLASDVIECVPSYRPATAGLAMQTNERGNAVLHRAWFKIYWFQHQN